MTLDLIALARRLASLIMDVVAVGGKNESNFGALKMVVSGIFWSLNIKGEMGNDRDAPLEGETAWFVWHWNT
ncbi:MAG: hypothetical protein WBE50_11245 [Methyloceanibacter sp.]